MECTARLVEECVSDAPQVFDLGIREQVEDQASDFGDVCWGCRGENSESLIGQLCER